LINVHTTLTDSFWITLYVSLCSISPLNQLKLRTVCDVKQGRLWCSLGRVTCNN
jgi:hypothetical protein